MIEEMVEAFVDAKMEGAEMSVALYRVATDVGRPALIKQVNQQSRKAAEAMLETARQLSSRYRHNASSDGGRDAFPVGGWTIPCHCPQSARITRASLSVIHGGRDS
jgi:hypothetical protein